MKKAHMLAAALVALLVTCEEQKSLQSSSSPRVESTEVKAPDYKEVWMMQGWGGYMGVMIGLKEKEYDYYFYSDVGSHDYKKPITGSYTINDKGIYLKMPHEHSDVDMYDNEWRFVKDGGVIFLASANDLEAGRGSDRWLRKVSLIAFQKYYDPDNPFLLQMNPHLELEIADQSKETEQGIGGNPVPRLESK